MPTSPPHAYTVAVAGNPNAGKTTIFNMLTGSNQTVGNYPGVTVEKKEGIAHAGEVCLHVVDLPGTYSLTTYSVEEVVARDFIVEARPDVIVDVVDASNLERNLYLALQLAEMGRPMVVALNMHDIAVQRGIHIDIAKLSAFLKVPVVVTVGHRNDGRRELLDTIARVASGQTQVQPLAVSYGPGIENAVRELVALLDADAALSKALPRRWVALKLLEEDAKVTERIRADAAAPTAILDACGRIVATIAGRDGEDPATLTAEHRYGHAAGIVCQCVTVSDRGTTLTDAIDTIVLNRVLGFVFVALVMFVTFKLTFLLADGWTYVPWFGGWTTPVGVFASIFEDYVPLLAARMEDGPLRSLVVHGIIAGVGGVMGFVPLIFFMFLVLAAIEDSGYIARIAFVLDRVLRSFGLQGKSILAMIVSGGIAGGCAVPGVMATRTLREEKDRLATMLVAPFMNCGAKMPVFALLIAAFFTRWKGEMLWLLAMLSWAFALGAAWLLRRTLIRGAQTPFVMELPPYHLPMFRTILRSSLERSWMYLKKAGTVILSVSILLWALMTFPRGEDSGFVQRERAAMEDLANALAGTPWEDLAQPAALAALGDLVQQSRAGWTHETQAHLANTAPDQLLLADAIAGSARTAEPGVLAAADALRLALDQLAALDAERQQIGLANSLAGRLGRMLEPVSRLAGFDWKDNIALIGGWAAKEVVVSTLGMAYSMGAAEGSEDIEESAELPLVGALRNDPSWTPLRAFAFIVFVMLYAPCLVTVVTIARESQSWRWAAFSTLYSTALAFVVATLVYQAGLLLHIGTVSPAAG